MIFAHVFENDWLGILPEGFLSVTILGLLVAGVILSTSAPMGFPLMVVPMIYLSVWALLVTVLLVLHTPFEMVAFYNVFVVDALAGLLKLGILGGATAALLMSTTYVRTHMVNIFEYGILILLASLAMLFLVSSYDFLSMYLAIEMQALCFYVLAGCKRNSEFSTEAGLKYFLLGAFSSGLLLFGMSLVYGCTGLTNVEDVAKLLVGIEAETEVHALTGSDEFEAAGMHPIHQLADGRRLVAIGHRIDNARLARPLGQSRAAHYVGFHVHHDDMFASIDGR